MNEILVFMGVAVISILAVVGLLALILMLLLHIDNKRSYKEDIRFARNLKIYTAVYAQYANLESKEQRYPGIVEDTNAWQEKNWIPTDKILMLIESGYRPEAVSHSSYNQIDFQQIKILLALKSI